jgi:cobalt-zinc-cadmium resistance protein CzcA
MADTNKMRRLFTQPLFWTIVYGALIAYGAYALWRIPVEVLPNFNFPQVSVITHYPGATSTELETEIARPIEAQLLVLPNLITVRSSMGSGTVETDARFRQGTNPQLDLMAVNSAVDRARAQMTPGLQPQTQIMGNNINEVADYSLQIPANIPPTLVERQLRATVIPELRALHGIYRVEVYGTGQESLWVQPNLDAMHRYGVPITAIVAALRSQVVLGPAGYLTQGHQDTFIELRSLPTHIRDIADIAVPTPHGPIPLASLAHVIRAPIPTLNKAILDGQPSIGLIVFKQPTASTVPVTKAVQQTLDHTLSQLPHGVRWVRIYNQGHLVHLIGSDLGRNLLIGGILAIVVLLWVLGAGRGIWILALTIPLSLLLAIAGLYATGNSLNLLTLGALTIAVGILCDDGIIVLESIYYRWENGDEHWAGVKRGLQDIIGPDVTGTLTTVSVFLPLLFVGGLAGLFFVPFALAIAFALLASLFLSITLIPLALGFLRAKARTKPTAAGNALNWLRRHNQRLFQFVARHPRASLAACVVLLLLSLAGLTLVPVNFLPLPNEGVLLVSFTLPPGSSMLETEKAVLSITHRMQADPAVQHVFARIGSPANGIYTEPAYAGEIQVTLKPDVNVASLDAIANRLLKEAHTPAVQLSIDTPTIERLGESLDGLPQPFVIYVYGTSIRTMRHFTGQITRRLRHIPALSSVFNNDGYTVTEVQITPNLAALAARHITPAQLCAQLAPLLNGQVIAQIPQGNVSLALYVRLADATHQSITSLSQLPIHTTGWTPLGLLANIRMVTTPNEIRHIDGARALQILATPTGPLGSTIASARKALAGLRLPPGYRIAFGGLYPQLESAALGLLVAAIAAFLLMFAIMILQFDGLLVPGLLLIQIPLAFTGGAIALLLTGVGLNAIALVAILTLVGICLNHGIVLLYRIQKNEASGLPPDEAVREAVHVRFRPIALTTLTAILGMLPTALGWGKGAAPEQGLAAVVLGGILWSALLSTNLLPALYLHARNRQLAKQAQA